VIPSLKISINDCNKALSTIFSQNSEYRHDDINGSFICQPNDHRRKTRIKRETSSTFNEENIGCKKYWLQNTILVAKHTKTQNVITNISICVVFAIYLSMKTINTRLVMNVVMFHTFNVIY